MKVRISILLTIFTFSLVLLSCSSSSGPSVTFSISEHNFANVNIGESEKVDFIITNKKNVVLTITKMTMSNYEFIVTNGGVPNTKVQPKADHNVSVTFYPALPGGLKSATLTIEYNFGFETMYEEISFTGTSVPIPKISVNPQSNDFKALVVASSKTKDFLISNVGTATMNVTGLTITGANASDYAIIAGTTGQLSPQTSMKVTIEFTPATAGIKLAELEIAHNGYNMSSPVRVGLSGSGYDVPVFAITPVSPYDYGLVAKGDKKSAVFTIENLGAADLNCTSIQTPGDFAVISGGAPFKIAPGATHDVEIEFNPTSYGAIQQTITFRSDTLTSPDGIFLKGEGFRGLPFNEDFEGVAKGQLPANWTITRGSTSNTAGTNDNWQVQDTTHSTPNNTGGSGKFVTADSDAFITAIYEDYLTTPKIDCTLYSTGTVTLEFDGCFKSILNNGNSEAAVEVYNGAMWIQLDTWVNDWTSTGEHKTYDITVYALGNSDLKVRFYYKNLVVYMYYFQVDNVKITRN